MISTELFAKVVMGMAANSDSLLAIFDKELNMPNIKLPVMNGGVFWNDLAEFRGWKLQQNTVTHTARILNSEGERIAWGSLEGMEKALDTMARLLDKYDEKS